MSDKVLNNVKAYLAGLDISGRQNAVTWNHTQDGVDNSGFPAAATPTLFKARLCGKQDFNFSFAGAVDLTDDSDDEIIESKMGVADVPVLVGPDGTDLADVCYFGVIEEGTYQPGGAFGERANQSLTGMLSNYGMIRGAVELAPIAFTNTNNGVLQLLGAVTANQKLYAALHTLALTGTSFVARVVSSATLGGAHTTRATFSTVTAKGAEFIVPIAGPFTDTYWGIDIPTVTGLTSATALGAVGIR